MNQPARNQLCVLYRPVAKAGAEWVDTFRAVPVLGLGTDSPLEGAAVFEHRGNIEATAKKNALVLRPAFSALAEAIGAGQYVNLIVQVNSVALASKEGATTLISLMKDLPAAARARVIVEVFNFPTTVTLDVLETITIPMLAVFDRFIAVPGMETEDLTPFANCNYEGVSLDLAGVRVDGGDAGKSLSRFWAAATKRRLGLYIQGVDDPETMAAVRYEAKGIEGEMVGPASPELGPSGAPLSSTA